MIFAVLYLDRSVLDVCWAGHGLGYAGHGLCWAGHLLGWDRHGLGCLCVWLAMGLGRRFAGHEMG